jgi:hypothetical protein
MADIFGGRADRGTQLLADVLSGLRELRAADAHRGRRERGAVELLRVLSRRIVAASANIADDLLNYRLDRLKIG